MPDISNAVETVVIASRSNWNITLPATTPTADAAKADSAKATVINAAVSQALSTYNDVLGNLPYASFTFADKSSAEPSPQFIQIHLSRPNNDPDSISVHIVPHADKGARYSNISTRAFGTIGAEGMVTDPDSMGKEFSTANAQSMLALAERCKEALIRFRTRDVIVHNNPQGVQEYVNQPLGGFLDTGGQNKYVECFARALGLTTPTNKENPTCQIIINRSGPSQHEILASNTPPQFGGDMALRQGVHFFPDENVCLAFAPDSHPDQYLVKEQSHPHWEKVDPTDFSAGSISGDFVTVPDESLHRYGISAGVYRMVDPGSMQDLTTGTSNILRHFEFDKSMLNNRQIVFANHYVDAAYLGELVCRDLGINFKSFFFLHSLGTFKADGLHFPEKLTNDIDAAAELEKSLRLTDRILGELWVTQACKQNLIANSFGIANHAVRYLGADHMPPTMIAVDEAAEGHLARDERRSLARATFEEMHRIYLETCDNPLLGAPVPAEKRLTLDQLIDAQIIFERSRHAEAEAKGKATIAKAMAIAMSAPEAIAQDAPNRVLMLNLNLNALHGNDPKFSQEIKTIIADLQSVRANGGHIITQPSFEYRFGFAVSRIADCCIALPAFEPFGMAVLEAAAAGATVIARSDIPSVREVLATGHLTPVQFPLRNRNPELLIADGAILVGGDPATLNSDPHSYSDAVLSGAAAAINAVTLGVPPTNKALKFDPSALGAKAAKLVQKSKYNWGNVAKHFLQEAKL